LKRVGGQSTSIRDWLEPLVTVAELMDMAIWMRAFEIQVVGSESFLLAEAARKLRQLHLMTVTTYDSLSLSLPLMIMLDIDCEI
jgi:hypothetical protein